MEQSVKAHLHLHACPHPWQQHCISYVDTAKCANCNEQTAAVEAAVVLDVEE